SNYGKSHNNSYSMDRHLYLSYNRQLGEDSMDAKLTKDESDNGIGNNSLYEREYTSKCKKDSSSEGHILK
ncbi:hypothetical protein PMALA_059800, partial [Plasmodium malariae]